MLVLVVDWSSVFLLVSLVSTQTDFCEEVPAIRVFSSSTIPCAILLKSSIVVVGASPLISGYTDNCGYKPLVAEDFRFIDFRFPVLFLPPFGAVAGVDCAHSDFELYRITVSKELSDPSVSSPPVSSARSWLIRDFFGDTDNDNLNGSTFSRSATSLYTAAFNAAIKSAF